MLRTHRSVLPACVATPPARSASAAPQAVHYPQATELATLTPGRQRFGELVNAILRLESINFDKPALVEFKPADFQLASDLAEKFSQDGAVVSLTPLDARGHKAFPANVESYLLSVEPRRMR